MQVITEKENNFNKPKATDCAYVDAMQADGTPVKVERSTFVGKKTGEGEVFNDYVNNTASGRTSHAEGRFSRASGYSSHAEGADCVAGGAQSHAEGYQCKTNADNAHAEGYYSCANGGSSHSEGYNTVSEGNSSHAEGYSDNAAYDEVQLSVSEFATVEKAWKTTKFSLANGVGSHAEGRNCIAWGDNSHAEGNACIAKNISSHAEGYGSVVSGSSSHAEGYGSVVSGSSSHAEGYMTVARGDYGSHAEGSGTTASGDSSHAEGANTTASGYDSHAEGAKTTASGDYGSHAEGSGTTASGDSSHAEGAKTTASGISSHAEGSSTTASGYYSHAANSYTSADGFAQTAIGYRNKEESAPSKSIFDERKLGFVVGANNKNAFEVYFNGNTNQNGTATHKGADYAEMFEWLDGNTTGEDRIGRFVTLEGNKIKLADSNSKYILGVVSGNPTVLGDEPMEWHGKYIDDEWGRPQYSHHEFQVEKQSYNRKTKTKEKKLITKESYSRTVAQKFDEALTYIPRRERNEWDAVGMLGKLRVLQDGTLKAGSFCRPSVDGIATLSEDGYYVMEVLNDKQAVVIIK